MFITKFSAALAAATLCLTAAPAFADTFQSNGKTVEVLHADLDLSTPAGQRALKQRISVAATKVCRNDDQNIVNACRQLTLRNVRAPVATVIARATSPERFADATPTRIAAGN